MFVCVDICMQKNKMFVCEDTYVYKRVHSNINGQTLVV
jgi:(2Fe-2S) ferredoxin